MNPIYQSNQEIYLFRLSDGAEHHQREEGAFEVRNTGKTVKSFTTLVGAFLYYLRLNEPADLWDVTEKGILIERKVLLVATGQSSACTNN